MRISSKFPIAVHTIMIIAAQSEFKKINSDIIAESTGVNAVIIRNIFKSLKQAEMILVSPGPGGAKLARDPAMISLLDIFEAVESMETNDIFSFHKSPSRHCPIGSNIDCLLKGHFDDAASAMKEEFSKVTIAMLIAEMLEIMPELRDMAELDS